jgi:DNA topoisomerase-1
MKHVVIVESPAKCKTINKYLGKDYTVLASFGHVRDLPSKNGSVDPEKNFAMNYQISDGAKKNVKAIEDAVKKADSLILATDPDREGEAISWHVYELLKKDKVIDAKFPVSRVSFNSITKDAVEKAMAAPRQIDMDLVNAQQARRALDYLVGFSISPILWRKLPGSRSAGRVQSVALRLICEREAEIEKFIPQEYWSIKADFLSNSSLFNAHLVYADGEKLDKFSIPNQARAEEIYKKLAGKKYKIKSVEKKEVRRNPKPPFTTSTLQQEASSKLGFGAKKTMTLAQRLYEGVDIGGETTGLITYMRTDGVDIAEEAMVMTRNEIAKKFGKEYLPSSPRKYTSKAKNTQEAHEAVRPTDPRRNPEMVRQYLDGDQLRLYELIWKRLMASQMEQVVMDQVTAEIASEDNYGVFRATGSTIKFDGFYKAYNYGKDDDEAEEKEAILPEMKEGGKVELAEATAEKKNPNPEQHFTQPPPRFSEATLVKRLEELSIGRPSTYAAIISVLQDRDYVKIDKKRFVPEMRGRLVTAFLEKYFRHYVEYDFTADLEEELDLISDGKLDWVKSLKNFWTGFKANVNDATEIKLTDVIENLEVELAQILFPKNEKGEPDHTCPTCKVGSLKLKLGKFGAFLGCSEYPTCNHTSQIAGDDSNSADADGVNAGASQENFETKILGKNEAGDEVTLRKGPYGFYVQTGELKGKIKPKRASIPKDVSIEDLDLEKAISLLSFPKELGKHPETGEMISVNRGRFGPYIAHNGTFVSIKNMSIFDVDLQNAVGMIAADALRVKRPARPKKVDKKAEAKAAKEAEKAAAKEAKKASSKKPAAKKAPAKKAGVKKKAAPKKATAKKAK